MSSFDRFGNKRGEGSKRGEGGHLQEREKINVKDKNWEGVKRKVTGTGGGGVGGDMGQKNYAEGDKKKEGEKSKRGEDEVGFVGDVRVEEEVVEERPLKGGNVVMSKHIYVRKYSSEDSDVLWALKVWWLLC